MPVLASEAIKLLQEEIKKYGDLPLQLYGCYGSSNDVFEIIPDEGLEKEEILRRKFIHIWTGIMTG